MKTIINKIAVHVVLLHMDHMDLIHVKVKFFGLFWIIEDFDEEPTTTTV
jgi:hypothetical protein